MAQIVLDPPLMPGRDLIRDAVYGAIGGVVATAVMSLAASALYRFEDQEKKKQEEQLRTEPPYNTMARRITRNLLTKEVSEETLSQFGEALHWLYGAGWGAAYGVMRNRITLVRVAAGLPFGIAFFLIGDEALTAGLKLTPPPQDFPVDAHIRGLVAHIVYAATAEGVIQLLDAVA